MSLCVVGSVAFDTVETPGGSVERALGGSAVYFSAAACLFGPVRLVGVVGDDFGQDRVEVLERMGVDLTGLQRAQGKTFFWHGRYSEDMNVRETVQVDLNVFGEFRPEIPETYKDSRFLFLANGPPATQASVLDQVRKPDFAMADSMDLWINTTRPALDALMKRVDALIINDSETRMLGGGDNLIEAAKRVLDMGPRLLIVKKGEHGAIMLTRDDFFAIPAYPCRVVRDPTGAGDTFAGGLMGCLAALGRTDGPAMRQALAYGTVLASFCVEDFSLGRLASVTRQEVDDRLAEFRDMLRF